MAHLIRIGNSFGVRIPQAILQQMGFKNNIDLTFKVTDNGLLISPKKQARDGWEQQFKFSEKKSKNPSFLGEFSNAFDKDEWEW